MKKVIIFLIGCMVLLFVTTFFCLRNPTNTNIEQTISKNKTLNNKVTYTSWTWIPMTQFDRYRPLVEVGDENSIETNDEESAKNIITKIFNGID